ncbi:MAG: amidase [Chloracidobacterium sp.]|nr:amidase [Chloracidobacterium sp.]
MAGISRREFFLAALAQAAAIESARASEPRPYFWTLSYAAAQIRKRRISSEELTRLCLDRIRQRGERLNAFITLTADLAMEKARACDHDLDRHVVRGPLHGVPIALKDNIDTAGILTTAASRVYADRVPTEDAEMAKRVFAAGAVLLGKTNLDEFAFAGSGTTGGYGPCRNPWNLERITGGSSAGSAAGLADGLFFASIGSDDGGSVRIPGSHCGVVGFKPSFGRASTRGIIPSAYSLDCPGPMTRSVEDAALMLQILAGNDPLDSITLDRPVPDYSKTLRDSIAQLRIGIPRQNYFESLHPDVASTVETAIELMRHKVREVRDVTLPQFRNVEDGGTGIELYHFHEPLLKASSDKYTEYSLRLLEQAKNTSAVRYVETLKQLRERRRDVRKTFEQVDVLLLPTMREPAPSIKETMDRSHRSPPSNTSAFNRYGLPALTLPCGFSRDGLPIGLQVVGPYFNENIVLTAAFAYQQATDWIQRQPA